MISYFVQLAINCSYQYLFSCSNCSRFGQWELLQTDFCVLLIYPHYSLSPSYFLVDDFLGSTCNIPGPSLKSAFFPQEYLVPFIGKLRLETKIWVLEMLIATGKFLLLALLQGIYCYLHINYTQTPLYLFHYLCIENHKFIPISLIPIKYQRAYFSFVLVYICNSLL